MSLAAFLIINSCHHIYLVYTKFKNMHLVIFLVCSFYNILTQKFFLIHWDAIHIPCNSPFKKYKSLVFDMFKKLHNWHYYQIPEHFHHPNKDIPLPLAGTSHSPAPLQSNHHWLSVSVLSLPWTSHISGMKQYLALYVWLSS